MVRWFEVLGDVQVEASTGRCRLESGAQEEDWDVLAQRWEFQPRGRWVGGCRKRGEGGPRVNTGEP